MSPQSAWSASKDLCFSFPCRRRVHTGDGSACPARLLGWFSHRKSYFVNPRGSHFPRNTTLNGNTSAFITPFSTAGSPFMILRAASSSAARNTMMPNVF
jgi:hypothetical protein